MFAFVRPATVIVGVADWAVKIYHTSGRLTPQAPAMAVNPAPSIVPGLLLHTNADVKGMAALQSSLVVTQILKVPLVIGAALVEYTLTKYVFPGVRPEAVRTSVLLQPILVSAAHAPEK